MSVENPCSKTGANVWLPHENAVVHTDLFQIGSVFFCKVTSSGHIIKDPNFGLSSSLDFGMDIHLIMRDHVWPLFSNCVLIAARVGCSGFNYDGLTKDQLNFSLKAFT